MITPYYRPQHRIFQNLRDTASNAIKRSGAMVIGTQYLLALNDGRELPVNAFATAGGNLFYRHIENGVIKTIDALAHKVRLDSVKLFGKDLEAAVATGLLTLSRDGADDTLRCSANLASTIGTALDAGLGGRSIRVGDLFVVNSDNSGGVYATADNTYYRKVKALLGKKIASSVAASTAASINAPTNNTATAIISSQTSVAAYTASTPPTFGAAVVQKLSELGGRFNGKLGEEITLVCTTGGAQGVAVFRASYTTLGTSENITPTGTAPAFTFGFTSLAAAAVTLNHTGVAAQGDVIRLVIAPVVTAVNPATAVVVSNPTVYTGSASTAYIIEVVKGGVSVATNTFPAGTSLRIYDSGGFEPVQVVALTDATSGTGVVLGTRGLLVNILTTTGLQLVTGDKFVVSVTAPRVSAEDFDGVRLDGPAVNPGAYDIVTGRLSVDIRQIFNGQITTANAADASAFTASSSQVVYDPAMGMMIDKTTPVFVPFVNGRGTLTVSFKAGVVPGLVEGPIKVTSRAALSAGQLGELSVENDLAYGAYLALSGSGNTAVSALRTSEDTVPAFEAALRKIRGTDVYYSLNPQTDSIEVAQFVALHCEEMSSPENMNFRRSYFGTDSPGAYTAWDTLSDGTYRKATLVGDTVVVDAASEAVSNFTSAIAPTYVGDIIHFFSLGSDLVITEIISSTTVRVSGAPPFGVPVAASFQLIKPDTADNTIDFVIGRSLAIENRRAVNVWCDRPTALINGEPTVISSKFIAAEIAGLRSALRPQQGLTMTEVTAIDEAPAMFARFTPEQLDRAAAAGVMIVTQEIEGGEIFIRHQLTTQTENGALQYEDSPGVVVDTFSFRIKDAFRNYLGKKNVTPTTLAEIYSELKQLAIDASQIEAVNDDSVGALILGFSDENGKEGEVTVEVDGDLADKVRTFVNLRVALPLNGLTHYVDASASVTI